MQATNWVPLFYHIGDLESGFPSLQRGFSEVNCWGLKLWICSLWTFLFQGPASIKSSWRWQKYQSDLNWIQSLKYKVSNTKSQIQSLRYKVSNSDSEYQVWIQINSEGITQKHYFWKQFPRHCLPLLFQHNSHGRHHPFSWGWGCLNRQIFPRILIPFI